MNILLAFLYYIQMVSRMINWLVYKNKITASGKVFMNFGSGMIGMQNKRQITLGKNVRLSGWLTVLYGGKITIGDYTLIGPRTVIQAWKLVKIGSYVMISPDVWIQDNNSHSIYAQDRLVDMIGSADFNKKGVDTTNAVSKPITIGDHVWIGKHAMIFKGVNIGNRSVVAAGSYVTRDVPEDVVVAGNPAKVVKKITNNIVNHRKAEHYLQQLYMNHEKVLY